MDVKECVDKLIEVLKSRPETARYNEAREKLKEYPEKEKRVREFRRKNYSLQNSDVEIDLFTEADRLADSFRDVYQDEIMQNYLMAEAALCKIVQIINARIVASLDFEGLSDGE